MGGVIKYVACSLPRRGKGRGRLVHFSGVHSTILHGISSPVPTKINPFHANRRFATTCLAQHSSTLHYFSGGLSFWVHFSGDRKGKDGRSCPN